MKNEDGKKEKLPLYLDGETVTGKVSAISLSLSPSLLSFFLLPNANSPLNSGFPNCILYTQVTVALKGKKLEHHGIRVEFVGQIEMFYDRGNHHDFLSLVRQLDPPGELTSSKVYNFDFQQVEKPYESYTGTNVRLR